MKLISTTEQLPNENEYVLIHLTKTNWGDSDDPKGNRYWRVAKFIRGISEEERQSLDDSDERKRTYRKGDEWANNTVPYAWNEFGPDSHFGQEVDCWCELPSNDKITSGESRKGV